MFLEYSKWGRSDDEHLKWARPPTKFTHPGKNKCVSIPSLQTFSPPKGICSDGKQILNNNKNIIKNVKFGFLPVGTYLITSGAKKHKKARYSRVISSHMCQKTQNVDKLRAFLKKNGNMSQNRPFFDKHFLKKSISHESWGQATRLKSCAYGSSSYGLFIEKVVRRRPHN